MLDNSTNLFPGKLIKSFMPYLNHLWWTSRYRLKRMLKMLKELGKMIL